MVRSMGIESENREIEKNLRNIAINLLREKKVDIIIGYSKGTVPLSSSPIIIKKVEDVNKLIWNNLCYINLAKYLVPRIPQLKDSQGEDLKIGIISKGCVGRAIIHLSIEHKINLSLLPNLMVQSL